MIDFNQFKAVNSRFGHQGGDVTLQDAARKLKESSRAETMLFRHGGDEFAAILPCALEIDSAIARIESALNSSVEYEGQTIRYSCSVGGAVCNRSTESIQELYRLADADMMQRKAAIAQFRNKSDR